ncbi:pectinesterase family protein [Gracilimonas mengyeensis]
MILFVLPAPLQAQIQTEYTVAKDGSGDFTSIQAAVDASKSFPPERITIYIKNGVYKEKVKVHSWNTYLTFEGESRDSTIITWDDYFDKIDRGRNSTFHTYTLLVEGNDFRAKNLTIENTAGEVGQAVALHLDADRVSIQNCKLLGNQDTVYLAGEGKRQYFNDCYIEGTTDFIFGGATAWFEDCRIHSKRDSYITAASTHQNQEYGFVFNNCRLTAEENVDKVYLGRPWRDHAKTVFMRCEMGSHVQPTGWHNWDKPEAEETVFYAEYENSGPGYQPMMRVNWSRQLSFEEAQKYTIGNVFDGWMPPMNE